MRSRCTNRPTRAKSIRRASTSAKSSTNATAIVDAIDQGRDPFAGKHGDFHKAYLSKVDNTLQPYRLFVPANYDGSKPTAMVVALHGMGGDENSMFDGYGGTLKREAEREGFIVACPKGRESASMYRGSAEQDVLDVLAQVERDYKVDPKRVYLMGHSMGGYGTWSVSIAHPDLFAALGPISGGGDVNGMVKIKNIPEYVVHGDNDKTVNVSQSRQHGGSRQEGGRAHHLRRSARRKPRQRSASRTSRPCWNSSPSSSARTPPVTDAVACGSSVPDHAGRLQFVELGRRQAQQLRQDVARVLRRAWAHLCAPRPASRKTSPAVP